MVNTIAFPRLGLSLTINRVAFSVFGADIYWYAVIILTGFLLGLLFAVKTSKKYGINPDNMFDIAFYGLIFGIISARIYYCIFDPSCLDGSILNVVKIWEGGLAIYGGLIGAFITAAIYCKIKKISFLSVADCAAPSIFIGQAVGRWGNFVNAEVYGKATDSLFGMSINGAKAVHPLFLYESAWNLLGLAIILLLWKRKKRSGDVFFFYTLWYGAGRLFLEGMRQPQYILYLIPGKLGISQAVALAFVIVSLVMLLRPKRKTTTV